MGRCSAPSGRLGTVADPATAATATAGERADYVLVFSGSPAAAAAGPPGQALGYDAPSCRLNALRFGILSVIRTSSRSSTCSSNRASHSTATQWAMVLLNTTAQRLDELNAGVDYIAGQVQVLMD